MKSFKFFFLATVVLCVDSACAQNIVGQNFSGLTANPVALTDTEVSELTGRAPRFSSEKIASSLPTSQLPTGRALDPHAGSSASNTLSSATRARISQKLDAHVREFLASAPWMPFQQTLGISGYEVTFVHPDVAFYTLSIALPYLPDATAHQVREYLHRELISHPPFAEPGYDLNEARPRESYDVPAGLRQSGRGAASNAFGIYAYWAYVHATRDTNSLAMLWPDIRSRLETVIKTEHRWDPQDARSGKARSEDLNGDVAGLIGGIRLAAQMGEAALQKRAQQRCRELLERRVNLDRVNPILIEPSRAASRSLHNTKLGRHCWLVPELGALLAQRTEGCAAQNLRSLREERNTWYMAYGDRLTGGENYTNPIHFPWALFSGAALVEQVNADELSIWIDVPWCRGDFYFMQKCVLTLWAAAGRPWETLDINPIRSAPAR